MGNESADSNYSSNLVSNENDKEKSLWSKLRDLMIASKDDTLRSQLESLIEEMEEKGEDEEESERELLSNILGLRGRTVHDVMTPKADIIGVEASASLEDIISLMVRTGYSRLPVYRGTLDDTVGMAHIRDVLSCHYAQKESPKKLESIIRSVLFVSPFMYVLELLVDMRMNRVHMALIVDEFGGVDGLVTIEDLIEEIVGEIEDEHDRHRNVDMIREHEGILEVHARVKLEELEEYIGPFMSEEEREEVETLGGLVFSLAGHIPARGELISHPSGLEFEVTDVDPRRIYILRIHGWRHNGEFSSTDDIL